MGKSLKAITFVYTSAWSLIFGLLTGLYLQTVNWLIEFFWQVLPHFFVWMPNLIATIGVAVSVTVILSRPLLTAVLLVFLMPLPFAPFVLISCYLTAFLQKKFAFLRP